jgi:catechol 2,3-dioxygenase-like lactoylglutathione lyase family enzyme
MSGVPNLEEQLIERSKLQRPHRTDADLAPRRSVVGTWRAAAARGNLFAVDSAEFDHAVIHIDDWRAYNDFYARVLGAEIVENPEGAANPLGAWAYRFGGQQVNVHGPWPGRTTPCCPPPLNEVGRGDLAFRTTRTSDENVAWLLSQHVTIEAGPTRRFGSRGWGTSVYCRDPSGNGIELIAYGDAPKP